MTRIALPAGDDRAMPPEGKTPLSPDEVTVIRLWIAAGASPTMKPTSIKGAPRLVAEVKFPELDPAATRRARAPLAGEVARLSARYPGLLDYESRDSASLELNAALRGSGFADSDLKAFLPLRNRILRIDLSGTSVTDASAQTLAQMTALQTLRLANARTGDATLSALSEVKSLKSLTVTGTRAAKSALVPLQKNGVEIHGDGNAD
ncbi:MAG TPA: hypothetical protein VGG66_01325, partial [Rhizomicrobium sp.]